MATVRQTPPLFRHITVGIALCFALACKVRTDTTTSTSLADQTSSSRALVGAVFDNSLTSFKSAPTDIRDLASGAELMGGLGIQAGYYAVSDDVDIPVRMADEGARGRVVSFERYIQGAAKALSTASKPEFFVILVSHGTRGAINVEGGSVIKHAQILQTIFDHIPKDRAVDLTIIYSACHSYSMQEHLVDIAEKSGAKLVNMFLYTSTSAGDYAFDDNHDPLLRSVIAARAEVRKVSKAFCPNCSDAERLAKFHKYFGHFFAGDNLTSLQRTWASSIDLDDWAPDEIEAIKTAFPGNPQIVETAQFMETALAELGNPLRALQHPIDQVRLLIARKLFRESQSDDIRLAAQKVLVAFFDHPNNDMQGWAAESLVPKLRVKTFADLIYSGERLNTIKAKFAWEAMIGSANISAAEVKNIAVAALDNASVSLAERAGYHLMVMQEFSEVEAAIERHTDRRQGKHAGRLLITLMTDDKYLQERPDAVPKILSLLEEIDVKNVYLEEFVRDHAASFFVNHNLFDADMTASVIMNTTELYLDFYFESAINANRPIDPEEVMKKVVAIRQRAAPYAYMVLRRKMTDEQARAFMGTSVGKKVRDLYLGTVEEAVTIANTEGHLANVDSVAYDHEVYGIDKAEIASILRKINPDALKVQRSREQTYPNLVRDFGLNDAPVQGGALPADSCPSLAAKFAER